MRKLRCLHLSAAVLAFDALVGMEARSAELEGALQYPPRSVGQDAQLRHSYALALVPRDAMGLLVALSARSGAKSREGREVRIRLPPARSPLRT
jgi:hypothetical protein